MTIPFTRSHKEPMVWIFGEPNIIYVGTTTLSREEFKIKATSRWNSIVEATGDLAMSDEVSVRLKFITKGENPVRVLTAAVTDGGGAAFNKAYDELQAKYKGVEIFDEGTFGSVARQLGRQQNNQGIVQVYQIWVEKYPGSSNAHFSLGQAYLAVEDTKMAKKSFKKAVDLDPSNKEAKTELDKLK